MANEERKKNFLEIGRGAMMERFDYELERVIDNILDPNTPAACGSSARNGCEYGSHMADGTPCMDMVEGLA